MSHLKSFHWENTWPRWFYKCDRSIERERICVADSLVAYWREFVEPSHLFVSLGSPWWSIRTSCIFNCEVKEPQFLQNSLFKTAQRWQVNSLGQASNNGARKPGKRLPWVWWRRGASARQSPLPRDVRPDGAASRREGLPEGPPTPLLVTPLRSLPGCTLASGWVTGRVDRAGRPARHVLSGMECSPRITRCLKDFNHQQKASTWEATLNEFCIWCLWNSKNGLKLMPLSLHGLWNTPRGGKAGGG